jgi:cell division protein FtsB
MIPVDPSVTPPASVLVTLLSVITGLMVLVGFLIRIPLMRLIDIIQDQTKKLDELDKKATAKFDDSSARLATLERKVAVLEDHDSKRENDLNNLGAKVRASQ